jgi:hypothetical protein
MTNHLPNKSALSKKANPLGYLLDLILYISVMFLVRELYYSEAGFIANGLFWSITTLIVATWRMWARGVTWKDLGLVLPKNLLKTLGKSAIILVCVVVFMVAFQLLKDYLPFSLAADTSAESGVTKFGNLKGNWGQFFLIIPFIWLESMLEELLDRGFLIHWLERVFSWTSFATVIAVVLQAALFGFRHSNDLSERSITVGIIGLVMGIAYVKFGRNLWPLIIAHCALNTLSMMERV